MFDDTGGQATRCHDRSLTMSDVFELGNPSKLALAMPQAWNYFAIILINWLVVWSMHGFITHMLHVFSMYGIYAYIYANIGGILMINGTIYTGWWFGT